MSVRGVPWWGIVSSAVPPVLLAAGACEIVTGLALRPARQAGRLILMARGTAGILVAAFPVRMGDGAPGSHKSTMVRPAKITRPITE